MRLDLGDDVDATPNLTPLIDIVFLLLVFFLVATTFRKEEVEMDLRLPDATTGVARSEVRPIIINVLASGALSVDGKDVPMSTLEQMLRSAAKRDAKQEVLIRGDTNTQFGVVARVLDLCRAAPLRQIAIGATPQQKGR
ncbi:MAG TPA: biopolymer transporter ExbD [Planctomycetota bacterium]|nr:biopolymer transporter ExbD [Planctomycetota bacterium]